MLVFFADRDVGERDHHAIDAVVLGAVREDAAGVPTRRRACGLSLILNLGALRVCTSFSIGVSCSSTRCASASKILVDEVLGKVGDRPADVGFTDARTVAWPPA